MTRDAVWSSPVAIDVENRLFRVLAVLRVVVLVNAVAVNLYRADNFSHPAALAACIGAMAAWTGVAIWAYAVPHRRTLLLLAADLAVTAALLLATPLVKGPDFNTSVPGFWTMGALLAWAVHYRWAGGLLSGVVLATVDLVVRDGISQTVYGNAFLLMIGGPIVGFMSASVQRMATERDLAERSAAIAAERARLARVVHDGVLQVLALVQRRGRELGGEVTELGRLAGEQERELRSLIREEAAVVSPGHDQALDLVAELCKLERSESVTVAAPATPVEMSATTVVELVRVVRACLDNVAMHVGHDEPAWVLLEAFPHRLELTVRDEGPGIPHGRLEEALTHGRLGVALSIRGRIADLGGSAKLATGSFGTEWEFVVPRRGRELSA